MNTNCYNDYVKVYRIVKSCETLDQYRVAMRIIRRYRDKWGWTKDYPELTWLIPETVKITLAFQFKRR